MLLVKITVTLNKDPYWHYRYTFDDTDYGFNSDYGMEYRQHTCTLLTSLLTTHLIFYVGLKYLPPEDDGRAN